MRVYAAVILALLAVAGANGLETFTRFNCGCPSGNCTVNTDTSGTCLNTIPYLKTAEAAGNMDWTIASMTVTCATATATCGEATMFGDAKCTQFKEDVSFVCGTCNVIMGDIHYKVDCDAMKQTFTVVANCNHDCSKCTGIPGEPGTDTGVVQPLDKCVPAVGRKGLWMKNVGTRACAYYTREIWDTSNGCIGAPREVQRYAQARCNDGVAITCSGIPPLPPVPGPQGQGWGQPNVLVSTCSSNGYCHDCTYNTVANGACTPNGQTGSQSMTCNGAATCGFIALYTGLNCVAEQFATILSMTCNQCSEYKGSYHRLLCNPKGSANGFTQYQSCNAGCTVCSMVHDHPLYQCTPGGPLGLQSSIRNFGIASCYAVERKTFSTSNCAGSSMTSHIAFASGVCQGTHKAQCGNFALTQVTQRACGLKSSCSGPGYDNCGTRRFQSQTCQHGGKWGWTATCSKETNQKCVKIAMFNSSGCGLAAFRNVVSPKCNSCFYDPVEGFTKITCDASHVTVTAEHHCNKGCSKCDPPTTIDFSKCMPLGSIAVGNGNAGERWAILQGIFDCNPVTMAYWNGSNTCQGTPSFSSTIAQGSCNGYAELTCAAAPRFGVPPITASTSVLISKCSTMYCTGDCSISYARNDVCDSHAAKPVNDGGGNGKSVSSTKYTCLLQQRCVRIGLFQTATCTGGVGMFTAVCGACMKDDSSTSSWSRYNCDGTSESAFFQTGCNSDCSQCSGNAKGNERAFLTCVKSAGGGASSYVQNYGLIACTGVRVQQFADNGCQGAAPVYDITLASGRCQMGASYTCGEFDVPPTVASAQVDKQVCGCAATQSCPYKDSTQEAGKCHASKDGTSSSVLSCLATTATCMTFQFFNDSTCSTKAFTQKMVCGSCIYNTNMSSYIKFVCDPADFTVKRYTGCDASCTKCTAPVVQAFPLGCDSLNYKNFHVRVLNMEPCTAVLKTVYPNSRLCQANVTAPQLTWIQQEACVWDQATNVAKRYACDKQPALPPAYPSASVLVTQCSDAATCAGACTSTKYYNGACTKFMPNGGNASWIKYTCDTAPALCVAFITTSSPTCDLNKVTWRGHLPCNKCMASMAARPGTYDLVACDPKAKTVQHKQCSSADCTTGCATLLAPKIAECITTGGTPAQYMATLGIEPCNLVRRQTYDRDLTTGKMCPNAPVSDMWQAQGTCTDQVSHVICGNFSSEPAPPANTIKYYQCGCPQGGTCPSSRITPGKCTIMPAPGISGIGALKVTDCGTTPDTCARFLYFTDAACTQGRMQFSWPCGSCVPIGPSKWLKINCKGNEMADTMTCTDSKCGTCSPKLLRPYGSCLPAGHHGYVFNRGTMTCNTVTLTTYANATGAGKNDCSGTPTGTFKVAQSTCSWYGLFECPNPVKLTPSPKGPQVLMMNCDPMSSCSGSCSYNSAPSGGCQPRSYGSKRVTCAGQVGKCVTIRHFNSPSCQANKLTASVTLACGSCNFFRNKYMSLTCNNDGTTAVAHGCNKDCSVCERIESHGTTQPYQCRKPPGFQESMFIDGVENCNLLSVTLYNTSSCEPGSAMQQVTVAEGRCVGSQQAVCGKFDIQSVTTQQCYCTNNNTGAGCKRSVAQSGGCVSGGVIGFGKGKSYQTFCNVAGKPGSTAVDNVCFSFALYTASGGNGCAKPWDLRSQKCGACQLFNGTWFKLTCDQSTNSVSATQCTAQCATCTGPKADFPMGKCVATNEYSDMGLLSMVGVNLARCDTARQLWYEGSTTCGGAPTTIWEVAQGSCSFGASAVCGEPAFQPNTDATKLTVRETHCKDSLCATGCKVYTAPSGVCESHMSNNKKHIGKQTSRKVTCAAGGLRSSCANMEVFSQGGGCNYGAKTKIDIYSVVCNTCNIMGGSVDSNANYVNVRCQPDGTVIYIRGCDSTCSACAGPNEERKVGSCMPGVTGSSYIVNNGIGPCDTVEVQHFDNVGCIASGLKARYHTASGTCGFGGSFTCGNYNIAPTDGKGSANVTSTMCQKWSSKMPMAPVSVALEGTCINITPPGPNATAMSRSVNCVKKQQLCASMRIYTEPTCSVNDGNFYNWVCNSCIPVKVGMAKITCDESMQSVTVQACDGHCNNCGPAMVQPIGKCVGIDKSIAGATGSAMHLLGVMPCDAAVENFYWGSSACQGNGFAAVVPQGVCGPMAAFNVSCSNAPALLPVRALSQVLRTVCHSSASCGGTDCDIKVFPSGECTPVGLNDPLSGKGAVAIKARCGLTVGWCAVVTTYYPGAPSCTHQNTASSQTYVCGAAGGISCDTTNMMATLHQDNEKKQYTTPMKVDVCNNAGKLGAPVLMLVGFEKCRTVSVQIFGDSTCSAARELSPHSETLIPAAGCRRHGPAASESFVCANEFHIKAPAKYVVPAGTRIFVLNFGPAMPYSLAAFNAGLTLMGAAPADIKVTNRGYDPNSGMLYLMTFVFRGANATAFSNLLAISSFNDADVTSAIFGASTITIGTHTVAPVPGQTPTPANVTANATTAPPKAPGAPAKKAKKHTALLVLEIVLGVVAVLLLVGLVIFMMKRQPAARSTESNIDDSQLYHEYNEEGETAELDAVN
jgi:hypothetical protein